MKVLRSFFIVPVFAFFLCTTSASAQIKPHSLPANATLEQTQEWLMRIIISNSTFRVTETQKTPDILSNESDKIRIADSKIRDLKFEGCKINYSIRQTEEVEKAGRQVKQSLPMGPITTDTSVYFDMADINPDEISMEEIEELKTMSAISMRTFDYKRVIKLKGKDTGTINVSVASMVVGSNVVEQVRDAIIHAVTLCRAK